MIPVLLLSAGSLMAAGNGGGSEAHDHLPAYAEEVFRIGPFSVTNSMISLWIVAAALILVAQIATRRMTLVPGPLQNFVEWVVESLVNFLGGILGERLARRTFWFFATIFILILFSNWFGLIPGIGTIGRYAAEGFGGDPHDKFRPYFRGANADLNMTMAMALSFALLWFYWSISEIGLKNFFAHIFAPKGDFNGFMKALMVVLFLFVGVIETFSIAVRPVALMFRLYGNIYAGENILETMAQMNVPAWLSWLPPLPFYFLELIVGFVQALVFVLLTAVFLKLMTDHDDHGEEHGHGHDNTETEEPDPA